MKHDVNENSEDESSVVMGTVESPPQAPELRKKKTKKAKVQGVSSRGSVESRKKIYAFLGRDSEKKLCKDAYFGTYRHFFCEILRAPEKIIIFVCRDVFRDLSPIFRNFAKFRKKSADKYRNTRPCTKKNSESPKNAQNFFSRFY